MFLLRVHAGAHSRRSCPVSVELDLDPAQPVILYQEPGRRPRACQLEKTETGSRLWWMCSRLDPGQKQDYRLVPVRRRKKPPARLRWEPLGEGRRQVTLDGQPLVICHAQPGEPWPGLREFRLPDGTPALRRLWFASGNLRATHTRTEANVSGEPRRGPVFARLQTVGHWVGAAGDSLLEETATYTFYATPADLRFADVVIALRAAAGPVAWHIDRPGSLLSLELAPELVGNQDFLWTNSAGGRGREEVDGRCSFWCHAVSSQGGLAVFDHPNNPGHPCAWHIDTKMHTLIADPFPGSSWTGREPFTLAAGEVLCFQYRLYLHSANLRPATVPGRYRDYAYPPLVEVSRE